MLMEDLSKNKRLIVDVSQEKPKEIQSKKPDKKVMHVEYEQFFKYSAKPFLNVNFSWGT